MKSIKGTAFCSGLAFVAFASVVMSTGAVFATLISNFQFDGNLTDSGTVGRSAIYWGSSVAYVNGIDGQALSFDGVSMLELSNAADFNMQNAFTVAAWIKNTNSSSEQVILSKVEWNAWAGGNKQLSLNGTSTLAVNNYNVGGNAVAFSSAFNDGQWHHVAWTYDPEAMTKWAIYLDGKVGLNSSDYTTGADSATSALRIGGRENYGAAGFVNAFTGAVDVLSIYDTALGLGEIQTLASIPEPSSMVMCSITLFGLMAYAWRKRN